MCPMFCKNGEDGGVLKQSEREGEWRVEGVRARSCRRQDGKGLVGPRKESAYTEWWE